MPSMAKTAREFKEPIKSFAEIVRERQIEYTKVQASKAPKIRRRIKPKPKIMKDNEYEERKEETESTERDKVKDLDSWEERENLGGIKEYANKLYLKIQR